MEGEPYDKNPYVLSDREDDKRERHEDTADNVVELVEWYPASAGFDIALALEKALDGIAAESSKSKQWAEDQDRKRCVVHVARDIPRPISMSDEQLLHPERERRNQYAGDDPAPSFVGAKQTMAMKFCSTIDRRIKLF